MLATSETLTTDGWTNYMNGLYIYVNFQYLIEKKIANDDFFSRNRYHALSMSTPSK